MKKLVRTSNNPKPVGTTSQVYKSGLDKVKVGELIEVTNLNCETLNIAKVVEIKESQTIVIEMIA